MSAYDMEKLVINKNGDTYTLKPDTTLTKAGVPADAKETGDEIDVLNEGLTQKANSDGSYENMKVGLAENLDPTVFIEDVAAYTFRTSGGNNDIGDFEKMYAVVGGSLVWNQLVRKGTSVTSNDVEFTFDNKGGFSAVGTASAATTLQIPFTSFPDDHVILFESGDPNYTGSATSCRFYIQNFNNFDSTSVYKKSSQLTIGGYLAFIVRSGEVINKYFKPQVFDLTAMFGPIIADYIYSLEQATAGAGVAWFRRYFPKDYYAYCEPHFEHVQVQAHDTVGFNQLDLKWFADKYPYYCSMDGDTLNVIANTIMYNTGLDVDIPSDIAGAFLVAEVKDGTSTNARLRVVYEDGSYDNLTTSSTTSWAKYSKQLANKKIVKVTLDWSASGTFSVKNACLNLHWDGSRDGEYEAYDKRSYPLDDVVLRGIPKIDASGNLYFEGDEYTPNGVVKRTQRLIDIDDSNSYANISSPAQSSAGVWYVDVRKLTADYTNNDHDNAPCLVTGYNLVQTNVTGESGFVKNYRSAFTVYDNAFEGKSAAQVKEYLISKGFSALYKITSGNYTTEEADPYLETQWCNDFGTERFVPASSLTRDVEVPVGHVTKYPPDLKAKLEMTPNSPPSNGLWLVKHENGENTYVQYIGELPADPDEDGSYYLKATRSSGTTTLSWEAQE